MKNVKDYKEIYFSKNEPTDKIWRVDIPDGMIGSHLFSFDKVTVYSFFEDYPQNLTKEQKEIFDKEYPSLKVLYCPR